MENADEIIRLLEENQKLLALLREFYQQQPMVSETDSLELALTDMGNRDMIARLRDQQKISGEPLRTLIDTIKAYQYAVLCSPSKMRRGQPLYRKLVDDVYRADVDVNIQFSQNRITDEQWRAANLAYYNWSNKVNPR